MLKKYIPNLLNIGLFPGYDYSTAQKMQMICLSSMAFYPEQFSNQNLFFSHCSLVFVSVRRMGDIQRALSENAILFNFC